ncbi:MAG: hypothetical protein RLZZ65_1777 [Bacteroidota bacterium]|jgi:hypothetical protein
MRESQLLQLRPEIEKADLEANPIEKFQNEVLRPILKFQHELWLQEWQQNPLFSKVKLINNEAERRSILSQVFSKNPALVQKYIGMVVGYFLKEEFVFYSTNKNNIDKRIKELLLTRLLSY